MLETLLESRAHSQRSAGGAIASVAAHTAIIAAAVYATAQAHVPTRDSPATVARFFLAPIPTPPSLPRSGSLSINSGGRPIWNHSSLCHLLRPPLGVRPRGARLWGRGIDDWTEARFRHDRPQYVRCLPRPG